MKELDVVKLVEEFEGMAVGTEGAIVLEYDGEYFEVEFCDAEGDTIDVCTTPKSILKLVREY